MPGTGGHEPTAVFVNADVVTMDERRPTAQAVAVRGGRILAVGDLDAVLAAAGRGARIVDLGGRTLIPGFVDGHGDFTQVARELDWVDLAPPPAGETSSIAEMLALLRGRLGRLAAEHKYILGVGYDDSMLDERRHPTKEDLDRVSTRLPIWVVHASRHMAVGNSMALDQAGIAASTPDPPGGTIFRRPGFARADGPLAGGGLGARAADVLPGDSRPPPPRSVAADRRSIMPGSASPPHTTAATDVGGMKMLRARGRGGVASDRRGRRYPLYQLAERMRGDTAPLPARVSSDGSASAVSRSSSTARPRRQSAWLTRALPGAAAGRAGFIRRAAGVRGRGRLPDGGRLLCARRSTGGARERRRRGGTADRGGRTRRAAARSIRHGGRRRSGSPPGDGQRPDRPRGSAGPDARARHPSVLLLHALFLLGGLARGVGPRP